MTILEGKHITKRFGGLVANRDISFSCEEGQIVGLIGPNGAGKTTLFNCLTGTYAADEGSVTFCGKNINGMSPQQILKEGIARTFQITKTFSTMTVLENVMVGAFFHHSNVNKAREAAMEILEFTKLADKANLRGSDLTVADRKRVEIARALATNPKMLMLDEAMAGLNQTEVQQAVEMVRQIRDRGISIMIVEHIMEVVLPLSDWILVMDQGQLIMEGTRDQVVNDERVISAYLGVNKGA